MRIYFDIDGVMANFHSAIKSHSSEINHETSDLPQNLLDIKRQRWLAIENISGFWESLPEINGIRKVLDIAKKSDADMFVLSGVPNPKNFVYGDNYLDVIKKEKINWVMSHFKEYFKRENIIISCGSKAHCVKPSHDDILIDDRPENIADWNNFGARGIVFQSVDQTIKDLEDLFRSGSL
jgi:hypothetical protein